MCVSCSFLEKSLVCQCLPVARARVLKLTFPRRYLAVALASQGESALHIRDGEGFYIPRSKPPVARFAATQYHTVDLDPCHPQRFVVLQDESLILSTFSP